MRSSTSVQWYIDFTALIVSRVLYAVPAWGGFLSSDFLNKIDSILRKAHKFGYTTDILKVTDTLQNADNKLFSLMFRYGQCLHTLLPDLKMIDIVLPSSGTSFSLPHCSYKLYKQCLSIVVFIATDIDMFCCVLHFVFHIFIRISYLLFGLIWFDLIWYFLHYNWMAFVHLIFFIRVS